MPLYLYRILGLLGLGLPISSCVTFAAPPPLVTFGGPATLPAGQSQVGLGAGSGASLFPGAHSGGHSWFGRWRMGITEGLDAGVDLMGVQRHQLMTFTGKGALRLRLSDHLRIETGIGAADDSDGKSLGAELGLVLGTADPKAIWGFYGALRVAGALSVTEDLEEGDLDGSDKSPNAFFMIGTIGASARLSDFARFVFEIGYGGILVEGYSDMGQALYVGAGLLFHVNSG